MRGEDLSRLLRRTCLDLALSAWDGIDVYTMDNLYTSEASMRTNIDIDDRLLSEAMRASGCKTKRATVEEGLRLLVRKKAYRAILKLRGKIHWDGSAAR